MIDDVRDDHQKRIGQVDQEPDLHRLDGGSGRQGGGDRQVD